MQFYRRGRLCRVGGAWTIAGLSSCSLIWLSRSARSWPSIELLTR